MGFLLLLVCPMCKVIGNNVVGEQYSELHASVARLHAPPPHVIIRLTDQLTTSEIGNNKWLVATRLGYRTKHDGKVANSRND